MGLDITAYEKVTLAEDPPADPDECYDQGLFEAFCYDTMEQSLRGLKQGAYYRVDGDRIAFRAGSYTGYNRWRDALCHAVLGVPADEVWANLDEYRDRPFFELIHFADNEGTIGPDAAADLAQDFDDWAEVVHERLGDDYARSKYDEWAAAFRLAAASGMVRFH